jgi:hypothetical protein
MAKDIQVQEIQVKLKFSPEVKIHKRTFSWRQINFNPMYMKDVEVDNEIGEISFTSEFNAKFSKEEIKDFILNKSGFWTGEGLSTTQVLADVVEIKEEAEIYGNK